GIVMSYASAFANSGAAASWLPWCAAATLDLVRSRGARRLMRAAAAAGIAFGLQLLAGEPALSVLTVLFAGILAASEIASSRGNAPADLRGLFAGGALAGIAAAAIAAPLLLPLSAVFPLTYRGQHLYSERAFGASPFLSWRAIEWLFPRFGGDPGALLDGAHWQYSLHRGDLIYIWCVTAGVLPAAVLAAGALRRDFWNRRTAWLATAGLVTFLFSLGPVLPLFRVLLSAPALRRLRYPIKFYLLTTLCVALLAGFAAERLRPTPARAGRGAMAVVLVLALLFSAGLLVSGPGGFLDRMIAPLLARPPPPP